MKRNEILANIRMLAMSQGFYGRLYRDIMEADDKEEILEYLENQNFGDVVSMVMFFEC